MILYVNGDSHAAAAEAVNPHAWAADDSMYWALGQRPHPDNERVSFGCELANHLNAVLVCDAQAGCSNDRIIRTTRRWLNDCNNLDDVFVVLQWSTWEREEWFYQGEYYQVGASGTDSVPVPLQEQYRHYIVGLDWTEKTKTAHDQIWRFHQELQDQNIPHVMFNGNTDFSKSQNRMNWSKQYLGPYDPKMTFNQVLRDQGFATVRPESWHFGADAHCFWAKYLLQYMSDHQLLESSK